MHGRWWATCPRPRLSGAQCFQANAYGGAQGGSVAISGHLVRYTMHGTHRHAALLQRMGRGAPVGVVPQLAGAGVQVLVLRSKPPVRFHMRSSARASRARQAPRPVEPTGDLHCYLCHRHLSSRAAHTEAEGARAGGGAHQRDPPVAVDVVGVQERLGPYRVLERDAPCVPRAHRIMSELCRVRCQRGEGAHRCRPCRALGTSARRHGRQIQPSRAR
jgi:hypothetical protein